ncbi:MAG: hypothetical protein ACI8RZ_001576 [Myxococcota bacterium]|jgi:hypothetical protein
MSQGVLSRAESLFDFFHERVDAAVQDKRASVSKEGVFYLTNLLVERGHTENADAAETLVELRLRAQTGDRTCAIQSYRELGDRALYRSGFFRGSLKRSFMSMDYYLHMGAAAYDALSRLLDFGRRPPKTGHKDLSEIYLELADRFTMCSDVLSEVEQEVRTEKSAPTDADVLQLYESWLVSGSPAVARRLRALGVIPGRSDGEIC